MLFRTLTAALGLLAIVAFGAVAGNLGAHVQHGIWDPLNKTLSHVLSR